MPLDFDPQFQVFLDALPVKLGPLKGSTALELRASIDGPMEQAKNQPDVPNSKVHREQVHHITRDNVPLSLWRFYTDDHSAGSQLQPAVFYIHGGGWVGGSVPNYTTLLTSSVEGTGVQFFAPSYRRAPEVQAPVPTEDCYAQLVWLMEHAAADFGVDPARIAVMGDSAGGTLAAGAALMARDRGLSPPIARQILVYPGLDDRTVRRIPADGSGEYLIWSPGCNEIAWSAYVGKDKVGRPDAQISIYGVPARAEDLSGLPKTYVDVGRLDLFHDEAVEYARRLEQAGVEVEVHVFAGVPHAFEMGGDIDVVNKAMQLRARAVQSF